MIQFNVTNVRKLLLVVVGCEGGSRNATEEDLRAAGYVKASMGFTLEQRLENQSQGLRIAYKELDELKARNAELVKMNEELVATNDKLRTVLDKSDQENIRLMEQVDMLKTMNDGLRGRLKKEYLEEVKDHNYTIDRVRELENALHKISVICDYPKACI